MRALLIGLSRQPLSWSLGKSVRLSEKQLDEISARLATLAEEASSVSISAAQAFLHAAQMFPILSYDADQWNQLEHDATEKYQRVKDCPSNDDIDYLRRKVELEIQYRDEALFAIAIVYEELLKADDCLSKVNRRLCIIDRKPDPGPPLHYKNALKYAKQCLPDTAWSEPSQVITAWSEPSQEMKEAERVRSLATDFPGSFPKIPELDNVDRRRLDVPDVVTYGPYDP